MQDESLRKLMLLSSYLVGAPLA